MIITGNLPWRLHSSPSTHSSSQPCGISPGHTSLNVLPEINNLKQAEYTNTQQVLPVDDNYITNSRHERLFVQGVILLKSNKEYVLTFNILVQILVEYSFLHEQASASISCAIQLIKHKYSQTSIIRDIMASWISSLR
jgi:hypothetical protein